MNEKRDTRDWLPIRIDYTGWSLAENNASLHVSFQLLMSVCSKVNVAFVPIGFLSTNCTNSGLMIIILPGSRIVLAEPRSSGVNMGSFLCMTMILVYLPDSFSVIFRDCWG